MMPHDDFYNFINELEIIFIDNFLTVAHEDGVDSRMKVDYCNIPYTHSCNLFNKIYTYLIYVYVIYKIYTTIKFLIEVYFRKKI